MKVLVPELVEMPDRKMLTITSFGDPNVVGDSVFSALYGTAFGTKFKVYKPQGLAATFGKLCAMWPDAHLKPKDQWTGVWGIPVPNFFEQRDLIQKDPTNPAKVEVWPGGTYAQILHKGPYTEEGPTVEMLHKFIEEQGYQMKDVVGSHEEEYLTSPDSKEMKTIIRYRLK